MRGAGTRNAGKRLRPMGRGLIQVAREDSYCRYCKKTLITYIRTENGEWMPCNAARVDFAPDEAGTDRVYLGDREPAVGYILTAPAEGSKKAYRPHWPECPTAKAARRHTPAKPAARRAAKKPAAQRASKNQAAPPERHEQLCMYPPERVRLKERHPYFEE